MAKVFPGAQLFVRQVADEQRDGALGGRMMQIPSVRQALNWINLAADPRTDENSRKDLLARIDGEINTLQAGITAIKRAVDYLHENGMEHAPVNHPGFAVALPPRPQTTRPAQGGYPGIQSAPIDPGMLGLSGSDSERRRRQAMTEHYQRVGVDEGMSGGPGRPDTGVNQSANQRNVPTAGEAPIMSETTYEQMSNPKPDSDPVRDAATGEETPAGVQVEPAAEMREASHEEVLTRDLPAGDEAEKTDGPPDQGDAPPDEAAPPESAPAPEKTRRGRGR